MAFRPTGDSFPVYENGDVEILLSNRPQDRLVLHSAVLVLHSTYFKALLSEHWSSQDSTINIPGTGVKWQFQLLTYNSNGDTMPVLTRKVSESGDESQVPKAKAWISAYKDFLGCIFHIPLDNSTSLSSDFPCTTHHIVWLVNIADYYDAIHIIAGPVENYLVRYQSASIAEEWEWLFKEVACRSIGDPFVIYYNHEYSEVDTTDAERIIKRKKNELLRMMDSVDRRLLTLTPLLKHRKNSTTAVTYATAVFRADMVKYIDHYDRISDNAAARYSKYSKLIHLYKEPRNGGMDFASPTSPFQRLQQDFTGSKLEQADFNHAYHLLRTRAAEIIAPLLQNFVKPPARTGKGYYKRGLLCMDITDKDLPWLGNAHNQPDMSSVIPCKRGYSMLYETEEYEE